MSLIFSVDGVSLTQCNPLSQALPLETGSTWYYYYYLCPTNSVTVQVSNPNNLNLNMCIFAQGGYGGATGEVVDNTLGLFSGQPAKGGGGGGGQVVNINTLDFPSTNFSNFSILLEPKGTFLPCQLITNTGQPGTTVSVTNIAQGYNGGKGQKLTVNANSASGGNGGPGGTGGGAAGNYGAAGYVSSPYSYNNASDGNLGTGYYPYNTGKGKNDTPNSTNVTFADGTSANIAQAGKQQEGGNGAGFLIYYQMLPPLF